MLLKMVGAVGMFRLVPLLGVPPRQCGAGAVVPACSPIGLAGRDDPFGGLAGERGDHVEAAVVVEDGPPVDFGGGGDQQVREGRGPVEAGVESS